MKYPKRAIDDARLDTERRVLRMVRHAMLCKGMPPAAVDARLGWREGRCIQLIGQWPTKQRRARYIALRRKRMTLNDVSDICVACGVEPVIRLEAVE